MADIVEYLKVQKAWSLRTFGKGKRTIGLVRHIEKELDEIVETPDDLMEWIDIIILGLDGYWRHGGTVDTLALDLQVKQSINRKRIYPRTPEDMPSEHIKE